MTLVVQITFIVIAFLAAVACIGSKNQFSTVVFACLTVAVGALLLLSLF